MGFFSFFNNIFKPKRDQHASSGGGMVISEPVVSQSPVINSSHFSTQLNKNNRSLLKQLALATNYKNSILEAAKLTDLPPSVICAIGSRESHWGIALRPEGPHGRGDYAKRRPRGDRTGLEPNDGGGYGRGLMQIDYDWHEFARTGNWQDPHANLMYASKILNNARLFFKRRNVPEDQMLRAILAAYNSGATATYTCIRGGKSIDCRTTGRDYSKDVLNRAGWFQLHGW